MENYRRNKYEIHQRSKTITIKKSAYYFNDILIIDWSMITMQEQNEVKIDGRKQNGEHRNKDTCIIFERCKNVPNQIYMIILQCMYLLRS